MVPSIPWSICDHDGRFREFGCDRRHRIYDWYNRTRQPAQEEMRGSFLLDRFNEYLILPDAVVRKEDRRPSFSSNEARGFLLGRQTPARCELIDDTGQLSAQPV